MKITDLLDDYYDDGVKHKERNDISARTVLELTEKKLGISHKKRFRIRKGVLIAAALAAVMSITAGAVGYTVWDAARKDAGLEDGRSIPEYTEYRDSVWNTGSEAAEKPVEGAELQLVSTLCSGSDLSVYMTLTPVTQEQADRLTEENQGLDTFAFWELSLLNNQKTEMTGTVNSAKQLEYDPETRTALICASIHGDVLSQITELTVSVSYFAQSDGKTDTVTYGTMTVPVTMSESAAFPMETVLENSYVDAQGIVAQVTIYAGYLSVQIKAEPFAEWCSRNGENAWSKLGKAYWGDCDKAEGEEDCTEQDAQVAYQRSWEVALNDIFSADSYLTMRDGSKISLSDLQMISAEDDLEAGEYTEEFELPAAVELAEIESLALGGVTCFPAG